MKSSTLWLITNSNIFIMKKLLFSSLLLLSSLASQAQNEYTIEGDVKGVKDGTLVSLFLTDGRVGSVVASDTIRNGTFFFKRNAGESGMDQLSLMNSKSIIDLSKTHVTYGTNSNAWLSICVLLRKPNEKQYGQNRTAYRLLLINGKWSWCRNSLFPIFGWISYLV